MWSKLRENCVFRFVFISVDVEQQLRSSRGAVVTDQETGDLKKTNSVGCDTGGPM